MVPLTINGEIEELFFSLPNTYPVVKVRPGDRDTGTAAPFRASRTLVGGLADSRAPISAVVRGSVLQLVRRSRRRWWRRGDSNS
jgi:hypothetical protein